MQAGRRGYRAAALVADVLFRRVLRRVSSK
jgi:hypothetical protein